MEFAFLVYAISMISKLGVLFGIMTCFSLITLLGHCINIEGSHNRTFANDFKKKFLVIPIVIAVCTTLIPSEKTMYLMTGAYVSQAAVQSSIGQDVIQILELKVKEQLKELQPKTSKEVSP